MHSYKPARVLSADMAAKRKERISLLLEKEDRNCAALRIMIPGPNLVGRDAEGQPFPTKMPECLKMRISRDGHVKIKYKREESGKIDEAFADGMKIPKKQISVSTDIFRGVRSLKHVREGYEKEFGKRDKILAEVEKINSELALNGGSMAKGQLEQIENRLDKVLEEISPDMAAVKRLGRFRIEEIFEYLEPAKYLGGFEKQAMISAACSKLVAFRNRYGDWRDGEVAKIMAYNKLRECSLRKKRDCELQRLLVEWAEFIEQYGYAAPKLWKRDMENSRKINELIAIMAGGNDSVLSRLVEIGKRLKDKSVEGEAKKELRLAYRELKEGKTSGGIARLLRAAEILEWSKPWNIAEELEKTQDGYMRITVERIKTAARLLLEENHISRSPALFREAARQI